MTREDVARVRGRAPDGGGERDGKVSEVRSVHHRGDGIHGRARRHARRERAGEDKNDGNHRRRRERPRVAARVRRAFPKTRVETTREETKPRGARGVVHVGVVDVGVVNVGVVNGVGVVSSRVDRREVAHVHANVAGCHARGGPRVRRTTRAPPTIEADVRSTSRSIFAATVTSRESFGDVEERFLERGATHPARSNAEGFAAGTFQRGERRRERRARRRGERERERPAVPGTKRSAGNAANDEVYHRGDVPVVVVVPPRMMLLVMTLAFRRRLRLRVDPRRTHVDDERVSDAELGLEEEW